MLNGPRPPRAAKAVLVFFGCCVPPVLAGLGLFGLSDLQLAAEARIYREAAVRARGVQSDWEARLGRPGQLAESWDAFEVDRAVPGGSVAAVPENVAEAASGEDAKAAGLHLLAARAELAAGRTTIGVQRLEEALAADPSRSGDALLALTHGLRLRPDFETAGAAELRSLYASWAERVPQEVAVEGISARLLGLLSAGAWLEPGLVVAEADRFGAALRAGRAPMPSPVGDRGQWSTDGLRLLADPLWSTIETMAQERLGHAAVVWDEVLMARERTPAAAAAAWPDAWLADASRDQWQLHALEGVLEENVGWLALRRIDDSRWQAAVHTAGQLDAALASTLEGEQGYSVVAFSRDSAAMSDEESIADPLQLASVPVQLHLGHSDPEALLRPIRLRLSILRVGLLSVAGLLAAAAAIAWVALRRDARLRGLRSTFVASVSHDLRTPVASIGLLAENMANGYSKGSEETYVRSLQGETARLRRLIDDLLDFGRIERGLPPRVRRAPVVVAEWVEAFADTERVRCHTHGCSLDLITDRLPISARLDTHAMERALGNLIDNAIKHGRADSVTLRVFGAEDTLVFEVTDSGSGVSASALRTDLFRPFERGSAKTAGTGLGLSIVRAIAEGHGGTASLRSGQRGSGQRSSAQPGAVATLTVATHEEKSA